MKQVAAKNNRRSKNFDHGKMQERSLEMDAKHDNQARRIVAQARARLPRRVSQNEIEKRAQEAVTFARDNALKTEAVADMRIVRIDAYRRNLGLTNVAAVARRIAAPTGEWRVQNHQPPKAPTRNYYRPHGGNGKGKYSDHARRQREPSGNGRSRAPKHETEIGDRTNSL